MQLKEAIKIPHIKRKRSSYTLNNALKFKQVFDSAMQSKKDYLIPFERPDQSAAAFHVKISDALKWFLTNWDKEEHDAYRQIIGNPDLKQADYAKLRGEVNFIRTEEGILLKFKYSQITYVKAIPIDEQLMKDCSWKLELIDFLDDSSRSVLNLEGLLLTEKDIEHVKSLLNNNNDFTFEVKINELKVTRRTKSSEVAS